MSIDSNPQNMFRVSNLLGLVVASQTNIIVQPLNAEAHEQPAELAIQAQRICDLNEKPVVLLNRDGNRTKFQPKK
jgi:hypothetical protein